LFLLLIASAFSTASISTAYYFHTEQVSGLSCQEGGKGGGAARILAYVHRGIVNPSSSKAAMAYCPLNLGSDDSYTINTVLFSSKNAAGGNVRCRLLEIDTLSGRTMREFPNVTHIDGNSTAISSWYNVEPIADGNTFTLICRLLPGVGIVSTSVAPDRI